MDLQLAIKGVFDAENKLRSVEGVNNPSYMSTHMMRLSQFTSAVEQHLADLEKLYEIESSVLLRKFLIDEKLAVTNADKRVKVEMGETKGQIVYLTRIVGSAWRQVGVIQSRINHLVREAQTS